MARRVVLSWSSGKDSAWALHVLRHQPDIEVVALLTTFNEEFDRVAMHAVRRGLVEAQAEAAGVPLWPVMLPWPCSNHEYEARMNDAIARAEHESVAQFAFGDLFLEDVRAYRVALLAETGIEPIFPIWSSEAQTAALAQTMVRAGMRSVVTCVDLNQLSAEFAGREYDAAFLEALPAGADPCGERGEFHTYCYGGPMFRREISVSVGKTIVRDGFAFADVTPI